MQIEHNQNAGLVTFRGEPEQGSITITGGRVLTTHREGNGSWLVIDCRSARAVAYRDGLTYRYGAGFEVQS